MLNMINVTDEKLKSNLIRAISKHKPMHFFSHSKKDNLLREFWKERSLLKEFTPAKNLASYFKSDIEKLENTTINLIILQGCFFSGTL